MVSLTLPTHVVEHVGTIRHCMRGMLLVRQFDASGPMYLIVSGSVRVLRMTPGAPPLELARLRAGDHVGEVAALLDIPRNATVEAITPVVAVELSPEQTRVLAEEYPGFASALSETLSARARAATQQALAR